MAQLSEPNSVEKYCVGVLAQLLMIQASVRIPL
jgi:hypothetical protein